MENISQINSRKINKNIEIPSELLTNLLSEINQQDMAYIKKHPEIQAILNLIIKNVGLSKDNNKNTLPLKNCAKYFKRSREIVLGEMKEELKLLGIETKDDDQC